MENNRQVKKEEGNKKKKDKRGTKSHEAIGQVRLGVGVDGEPSKQNTFSTIF